MTWANRPTKRFLPCNGRLLKDLRTRAELTQSELGKLAGYTQRLVAKAEAGGSVKADTIEVLAATLCDAGQLTTPDDLVSNPAAIVREIVESFAKHERQCVAHCHHLLHDDLIVSAPGDQGVLPFAGVRHTPDGFDDFWEKYFQTMKRYDKLHIVKTMRLIADGDLVVALVQEDAGYLHATVRDPPTPLTFVFQFKHGKVIGFEDHFDATAAAASIRAHNEKNGSSPHS